MQDLTGFVAEIARELQRQGFGDTLHVCAFDGRGHGIHLMIRKSPSGDWALTFDKRLQDVFEITQPYSLMATDLQGHMAIGEVSKDGITFH